MIKKLAQDFNLTGIVFLRANRDRPITVMVRFKTEFEPNEEIRARLGWRRHKNGVWLVGDGAFTFLREIRNSLGNEFGMRDYVDLTLEILELPQGLRRKSLLAKHRHRTSRMKGRPGRKRNWRKEITESPVVRRIISDLVWKAMLRETEGPD